jgi:hypothetical protein
MASTVPKPVSAALGLVPAVLGGVRRLPTKAVQLPVIAVSSALAGLDYAKREYGDLSDRGERLVARLRGTSFDELEDRFEDRLKGTPVAGLYDKAEDALEDVGEAVGKAAGKARESVNGKAAHLASVVKGDKATGNAAGAAKETAKRVADDVAATKAVEAVQETLPEAEQPKGVPTPKATEPDSTRVDTAATPDVVRAVEKVAGSTPAPSSDELPLPDYDGMTLGALRGRLRSLDVDQLVALRAYEKSKADRLPVVTMLDNRIAKLAAGDGAATGNAPDAPSPKASTAKKPPKKTGKTAPAKTDGPPHTKVRTT